jgi:hypothetical protein
MPAGRGLPWHDWFQPRGACLRSRLVHHPCDHQVHSWSRLRVRSRRDLGSQTGSQRGANNDSHQAIPGHGQHLFQQLDGLSGNVERYPATPQNRLKSGTTRPLTTAPDLRGCAFSNQFCAISETSSLISVSFISKRTVGIWRIIASYRAAALADRGLRAAFGLWDARAAIGEGLSGSDHGAGFGDEVPQRGAAVRVARGEFLTIGLNATAYAACSGPPRVMIGCHYVEP